MHFSASAHLQIPRYLYNYISEKSPIIFNRYNSHFIQKLNIKLLSSFKI